MKYVIYFFILLWVSTINGFTQDLDSFYKAVRATESDSAKIRLYNKTASDFLYKDIKIADRLLREGLQLAKEKKFMFGQTELINMQGACMYMSGNADSTLYYFNLALKMSREHGFKSLEAASLNNLGMYNREWGNQQEALKLLFQALAIYEKAGNERKCGGSLNNIGLIHQELTLFEKALIYHRKASAIFEKYHQEERQITSLINIGICLDRLGNTKEAIHTYKRGIALAEKSRNLKEYTLLLLNLAHAYQQSSQYDLAIQNYLSALEKSKQYGANKRHNVAIYDGLVLLYNKKNQASKALFYANEALKLIDKDPDLKKKYPELFLFISESYFMLDDYAKAREFRGRYTDIQDSLFSEKVAGAVAGFEVKHETEKKENQLLEHRARLAEQKLAAQNKNYLIAGIVALALIIIGSSLFFFRQQKLKARRIKTENDYRLAMAQIESRERLQAQKSSISRDLHDNIGAYTSALMSELKLIKPNENVDGERVQDLIYYSQYIMNNLRETIWTLNQEQLTVNDLFNRFKNFAHRIVNAFPHIQLSFEDKMAYNKPLKPTVALNVFAVLQEAFMNACKHSNADRIVLSVYCRQQFRFVVKDNGTGLEGKPCEENFGIQNMKERAAESGFLLEIVGGNGLSVILTENTENDVL